MDRLYYIELDGQQYGPYESEQIKNFGLFADTLILVSGSEDWLPATNFPELASHIAMPEPELEPEPVISPTASDIYNMAYYYKENEQLYGPLSLLELVYLDVREDTVLGINSAENWHYASEIENLLDTLESLADLEKEESEPDDEPETLKKKEIILNKQELEEVIEEQELELVELERENQLLKSQNTNHSGEEFMNERERN
jgi:hypothetical protein